MMNPLGASGNGNCCGPRGRGGWVFNQAKVFFTGIVRSGAGALQAGWARGGADAYNVAYEGSRLLVMAPAKDKIFEVACPDCGAMLKVDAATGLVVSHTPAPRKKTFEDLETAAKAMREQDERKESIFRQSVDAERNKADLLEKKFAEALRKAKDAPEGKPLREFDLD
jgi:hypothetical protein